MLKPIILACAIAALLLSAPKPGFTDDTKTFTGIPFTIEENSVFVLKSPAGKQLVKFELHEPDAQIEACLKKAMGKKQVQIKVWQVEEDSWAIGSCVNLK